MKKIRIIVIIALAIVILTVMIIYMKFFVFGKTLDISQIVILTLSITSERVAFNHMIMSSAEIMSWYSYRIDENTMYIRMRTVLVGGIIFKGMVEINGDFSDLEKVVLEDGVRQRVIWEK